jgi:hypothetical protein
VQTVVDGDHIVVYTPDTDPKKAESAMRSIFGSRISTLADWTMRNTSYSPNFRLTLHDVDQRTFLAERYCYRSSIDGWIQLSGPSPLEPLARILLPHLGHESWYDLY